MWRNNFLSQEYLISNAAQLMEILKKKTESQFWLQDKTGAHLMPIFLADNMFNILYIVLSSI